MTQPQPPFEVGPAEIRTLQTPDGITLSYECLGEGRRTVLLANGLGGRLYAWKPLISALWREYRFITWDYRGLFGSPCSQLSRLAVRDHAEDALRILQAEGVQRACWVGWSMGVQVSLEACIVEPERVAGLVLLNGTYGHVFSSAFQPVFHVPRLWQSMHAMLEWVRKHNEWSWLLAESSRQGAFLTIALFWLMLGKRAAELRPVLAQYTDDIFQPENFPNYLRLFQELDAHSVYHHLPQIDIPALVISGRFDVLTPAYQSRQIAQRLPRARHLHLPQGSHFVLVERPEIVVPAMQDFLRTQVRW